MKYYIKPQEAAAAPVPKSEKGIASLVQGVPGKSAYQVWLDAGNAGDVSDFFASLKGEPGTPAPTPLASAAAVSGGTEVAFDMNADGSSDASFTVVDGVDGEDADPLTVESQTILESGNTEVSLSDGTTFEIQRGQQGKSVTVADSVINAEGDTEVTFSDGTTFTVNKGADGVSVTVSGSTVNADGDTEVTFSDGTTVLVQRGKQGIQGPQGEGYQNASSETLTPEWMRAIVDTFRATSTERESGKVASQEGVYRDGSAGTFAIKRTDRSVSEVQYTHAASGLTLTETITRDVSGKYESTTVSVQ